MTKITKITLIIATTFLLLAISLFIFYSYTIKSDNQIDDFEEFKDTYIFGRPTNKIIGEDRFGLSTTSEEFIDLDKNIEIPKLRKISSIPVAGFISFKDKEGTTAVRYTERSTGHIYEAKTNSLTQKRISNTTIPRVQESIWVDNHSTIIRYLDEKNNIKSFYAEIVNNDNDDLVDGKTEGVFLANNMKEVIPLGNKLFYLLENTKGSWGFTSDLDGKKMVKIFDSPVKEWLIERPKQGILTLTTKPSTDVFGYLYFLNINTERMNKKLGGRGLTTLTNRDFSKTLFSKSSSKEFSLFLYNIRNEEVDLMPFNTLPEKCVWSNNNIDVYCGVPSLVSRGNYPDEWYQGIISFSDDIWRLDTDLQVGEFLLSFKNTTKEEVDVIKPALSPDEDYLFFINKKDLTLWSLEL